MNSIIETYGGTEWSFDPPAWYGDLDQFKPYIKQAKDIFQQYPDVWIVNFNVLDTGEFLDYADLGNEDVVVGNHPSTTDPLAVREDWDVSWRFKGLFVHRHYAYLEWYNKHGDETLSCTLPSEIVK